MSIVAGTRLGPYEIVAPIGAGGMGEVFKARDTRLNRIVAIKILPAALAQDVTRRQRLHREAQIISQLSHPNICVLYDTGSENGTDFLVMEYVEGHPLADHLTRGAIPTDEVVRIGIEIAEGLDRAHGQGVIHRDLKPGNIMLTKSGVKLLDFGLATMSEPAGDETVTKAKLTAEGAVLGTVQYMAPEQLEGRPADERSDIFALGAVLYEMATGKAAFAGVSSLQPRSLDHVIQTCLEKDPDRRWQSARDIAQELRWVALTAAEPMVAAQKTGRWKMIAAALSALLLAAMVFLALREKEQPRSELFHLTITPPPDWMFGSPTQWPFSVSPDGKHIAFMTDRNRLLGVRLWIRPLSGPPKMIEGTASARHPFWSADSQSVAFIDEGVIRKVDLAGGSSGTICEGSLDNGASWGANGTILFANPTGIYRAHANGGKPTRIVLPKEGVVYFDPVLLPDGHHYLLSVVDQSRESTVVLRSLDDDAGRVIVNNAGNATWLDTGHLLFIRGETLMAQPFDLETMRVHGEPVTVADRVGTLRRESMNALYSASRDGRVIALQPGLSTDVDLVELNAAGQRVAKLAGPARLGYPVLSLDGTRIACVIEQPNGDADIWTVDRARGVMMRVTSEPSHDTVPIWSPDGRWIAYAADRDLYRIPSAGGRRELLVKSAVQAYVNDWSRDGQMIIFTEQNVTAAPDVKALRVADRAIIPLLTTRFREQWARLSPDGKWIAYQSSEAGANQVFVQRLADGAFKTRVSTTIGSQPEWSADGRKVYFKPFLEVTLRFGENVVQASDPQKTFKGEWPGVLSFGSAMIPDGSGIIGRVPVDTKQSQEIEVLLNATSRLP